MYRKIEAELAKCGVVYGWKQCCDKLKEVKKYMEVVNELHCRGVGVELDDDTIETDWPFAPFFPPG